MDALTIRTRQCGLSAAALVLLTSIAIPSRADSIVQPPVPVQREQLKREVDAFVSNAIAQSHNDTSPERWNKEVCPLVAGLNKEQGEFILARLSQIAKAAGAPLGDEKCNPNFFIVFSKDPEPGLRRLADHHDARAFNDETKAQLKQFVETPRPARVWYNAGKTSVEGTLLVAAILDPSSGAARHFPAPQGLDPVYNRVSPDFSSRVNELPATRDILSVIVVVDTTQVRKLNFGQISDYIGLTGLAQTDLEKDLGNAPTILNVFRDPGDARPMEMTVWDKALLHALYSTTQRSKAQLSEMQTSMLNDITAKARD
jgi:hypothetical protein